MLTHLTSIPPEQREKAKGIVANMQGVAGGVAGTVGGGVKGVVDTAGNTVGTSSTSVLSISTCTHIANSPPRMNRSVHSVAVSLVPSVE